MLFEDSKRMSVNIYNKRAEEQLGLTELTADFPLFLL